MPKRKKWVGSTFGYLTVMTESKREGSRHYFVKCKCKCGKIVKKRADRLNCDSSCGCFTPVRDKDGNIIRIRHGYSGTYEHNIWMSIISRCGQDPYYKDIIVFQGWKGPEGFLKFLGHIGKAPSKKYTIDRIDNNLGYMPGNIRWATSKEQARNRSTNKKITALGKTQCWSAWAEETGIDIRTLIARKDMGWNPDKIMETPLNCRSTSSKCNKRKQSKEYRSWQQMKRRCFDVKSIGYKNYGGKGISIHKSWLGENGFFNFLKHIGSAPSDNYTVDRIDPNGNYEPGNVRWDTAKNQSRNKRNTIFITAFGETKCLSDWSEALGIKRKTIYMRLKRGWSPENSLSPVKQTSFNKNI